MATKVSKKNQDDDELDQLSDNNMEICDMCKKPGRILCCDYCYRSFHGDCGASGVNTGRTWKCPVCIQRESERCKNSGEFLPDPQATLVYQCSCCAAKLLASSADVPLWLIVTSKTNLCHFFDISQRQEVYDLILQGSNAYKQLKDLVLRAACFENKQKHLFHVCNQCTAKSRKKILIEQKSFEGKSFARVRLANQSELHDQWIKVKPADILAPSSGENCTDSRVERIVAWHRPPQQARKSHREMLEWIRNRDLSSMSLGSADCLSFYVKWHTHDEIFCTWESEYFLRFYYKYIFDFALKKVFEDEEKLHQDKSFAKQLTKDSLLQISKSVSPLISEKTRQWAKKLLKQDEEGADILVDAADGYQQALLSYVSLLKEKSLDQPILLVTQKKNAKNWAGILDLFFPNIESLRLLNSSKTCIEYEVLRFELFQTGSTPKFDLLLTEESTFNKLTNQIMSLDWKVIILDLPEKSCESVLALSYFNKPYHRASSRRVAVFPNKGQLLSQYDYSLLHFLTNSKAITQILPRVFSENNPHVLEFRLLKGKKVNCSLSAKALKPILVSGPSQGAPAAACVEYRNIILRYSDSMKLHLQEQIHQSIDALVERSRPKLLELLAEVLTCLERGVFTSKSDENKYLENDVKLRFAIKLIERSRQEGRMDKVVFVFPTPMSQIRCAPNLQKLCKYCYWQVIEMSDAFEIQTEVANFNKVDKKFTVLSIVSSELSRVEGIRCSNFILYGFDGVDAQSQIQKLLYCVDSDSMANLTISRLVYEGIEEKLELLARPLELLTAEQADECIRHKYNYVVNVATIFKLEQHDNTFTKLLTGVKAVTKEDQCIVDRSVPGEVLFRLLKIRRFDFHFENVVKEANPITSWEDIRKKYNSQNDVFNLRNKKVGSVHLKRNQQLALAEEKAHFEFEQDAHLDTYLQKRFLSPRIECVAGLPQPLYLHTMDFGKLLTFVDFLSKRGLYFETIEAFYKKYCSAYPDEVTSSPADFENFKHLTKEFIHLLGYHPSQSFRTSPLLCGLRFEPLHFMLLALTVSSKLQAKYAKSPEEFLLQENISARVNIIPKINDRFIYCGGWNNFDLYCLAAGLAKHGLEEWESIVKDEAIWLNQSLGDLPEEPKEDSEAASGQEPFHGAKEKPAAARKPVPQGQKPQASVVEILFNKLIGCSELSKQVQDKATMKQLVIKLLKKKAHNYLQFLYENSKDLSF